RIIGERYDGRRLIRAFLTQIGNNRDDWLRDADLEVRVGAFTGFGGEVFEGFSLQLSTFAGRLAALTFASQSHNGLAGVLRGSREQHPVVDVDAGDAGSLLRALDLYGRITGGHLSVTINLSEGKPGERSGRMTIRDSVISEQAGLGPLGRAGGP